MQRGGRKEEALLTMGTSFLRSSRSLPPFFLGDSFSFLSCVVATRGNVALSIDPTLTDNAANPVLLTWLSLILFTLSSLPSHLPLVTSLVPHSLHLVLTPFSPAAHHLVSPSFPSPGPHVLLTCSPSPR
ncbi:hypothetical protein EYF80_052122 [Liparis tanakae]|uniref:Uncharacterized protein n=1 Tax=Liparis tanakae TaxID=230148 RepID=A0A4Z2FA25_9TELE|nr:hypothetical protein EYF80_052122 [Liparis tanakae]